MVTTALAAGPDGKLWFAADSGETQGIARISTDGKLGKFIPTHIAGDMAQGPHGRVWFPHYDPSSMNISLATATRSGTVRIRHLHEPSYRADSDMSGLPAPAVGPDGNIWVTDGVSSIVRISGLDATAARPKFRHGGKS
jgi:streptogramin lyase